MDVQDTGEPLPPPGESRIAKVFHCGVWLASVVLWAFAAVCYWRRFDLATYVTLFPPWTWAALGMLLAWPLVKRWMTLGTLAALWLAFLITFADSPASLLRSCWPGPAGGQDLRVISLNSAGRAISVRAAGELEPDILLVQESFAGSEMQAIAREKFGPANFVWDFDASIMARGKVTLVAAPPEYRNNFIHARVELDGKTVNVISLRLVPCPIRLDFWSADCWRYYRGNRMMRRMQVQKIAGYVATLPADVPLIVGGDFNCPPWDPLLELLEPRLTDAFTVAGRGWGATIIELGGVPLIRIDQIWTNSRLLAVDVFAARAEGSDHHMTVADFSCEKPAN